MNICLLSESGRHPVLDDVLVRLAVHHRVGVLDPATHDDGQPTPDADLYLLKSRSPQALRVARTAQARGAIVVNRPGPTARCQDRLATAGLLASAAVATPRSWSFQSLGSLAAVAHLHPSLTWPLVVKSRHSRRGDLVQLVRTADDLAGLVPQWSAEPVVVQEFARNEGLDVKVWVVDGRIRAALRPSALNVQQLNGKQLDSKDTSRDLPLAEGDLPAEWARTALAAGDRLGLDLFGVDLVVSDGRPVVVDVNAFPGFRSADGAAEAIAAFVQRLARTRKASA